jgi:hypothetical protein
VRREEPPEGEEEAAASCVGGPSAAPAHGVGWSRRRARRSPQLPVDERKGREEEKGDVSVRDCVVGVDVSVRWEGMCVCGGAVAGHVRCAVGGSWHGGVSWCRPVEILCTVAHQLYVPHCYFN